jgi:CBS domain-containing protein
LPVIDRDKRLVGIISLGDVARSEESRTVGQTVADISEPGGQHSQTIH